MLRKNKNMINENDLKDVYVVGQTPRDQTSDYSEGSELVMLINELSRMQRCWSNDALNEE